MYRSPMILDHEASGNLAGDPSAPLPSQSQSEPCMLEVLIVANVEIAFRLAEKGRQATIRYRVMAQFRD